MGEKAKEIIQYLKKKITKYLIIGAIVIVAFVVVVIGGGYLLTLDDGIWDDEENAPKAYRNNVTVTGNGLKTDIVPILEQALKNSLGYPDEEIEKIHKKFEDMGYTDEELEMAIIREEMKILGLEELLKDVEKVEDINVPQLIWELNKDMYRKYLDKYEQLEYLMNAEMVTKMPYINTLGADKVNGKIYFDRYIDGSSSPRRLSYIDETQFDALVSQKSANVLNYFTITENNEVKVAYYKKESVTITTNDASVDISEYDSRVTNEAGSFTEDGYEVRTIPYNTMIPAKYTMPFEFLWALLVITEDYDFVEGLAKLAYDSEIIISIYDSISESTVITEYDYSKTQVRYSQVKTKQPMTKKTLNKDDIEEWEDQGYIYFPLEETENPKYIARGDKVENLEEVTSTVQEDTKVDCKITKEVYSYMDAMEIKVTYANVWAVEYKTEYNSLVDGHKKEDGVADNVTDSTQGEETETDIVNSKKTDQVIRETEQGEKIVQPKGQRFIAPNGTPVSKTIEETTVEVITYKGDVWYKSKKSPVKIKETTYSYSTIYVNDPSRTETREKTNVEGELDEDGKKVSENFSSLFNSSPNQGYLLPNREWLMDILEGNSETSDMLDLTKYLLNKATGKDYYKLDGFDFTGIFNITEIGGLYGGSIEEQLWVALKKAGYSDIAAAAVLGNVYAESGIRSNNLQDSYETSLKMSDEQYTEAVDSGAYTNFANDEAGYGLAQWTSSGRKQGLYAYAQDKGVSISDPVMQIEYLLAEISGSGANGHATYQMSKGRYGYTYDKWANATSIEEATKAFCYVFERPSEEYAHIDKRIEYANKFYNQYQGVTEITSSVGNIELTGENKQKMEEMLNDAIRIANDNRYGYSQAKRYDEFYYDCSSLVQRLYTKYFNISVPITTADYSNYNGYYIGNPTSVTLMPGDVLWRQGHVTLYIGNGNYVAAHTDQKPKADQITVYRDTPSKYTRVYRFIK